MDEFVCTGGCLGFLIRIFVGFTLHSGADGAGVSELASGFCGFCQVHLGYLLILAG